MSECGCIRSVCKHRLFLQEISRGQLTLEALLDMSDEQVCETLQKFGANMEECARLNASLSCLRSAHKSGEMQQQANSVCVL